jgi:hypothetical protein
VFYPGDTVWFLLNRIVISSGLLGEQISFVGASFNNEPNQIKSKIQSEGEVNTN